MLFFFLPIISHTDTRFRFIEITRFNRRDRLFSKSLSLISSESSPYPGNGQNLQSPMSHSPHPCTPSFAAPCTRNWFTTCARSRQARHSYAETALAPWLDCVNSSCSMVRAARGRGMQKSPSFPLLATRCKHSMAYTPFTPALSLVGTLTSLRFATPLSTFVGAAASLPAHINCTICLKLEQETE